MFKKPWMKKVPMVLTSGLVFILVAFWTYWGAVEMYYEGWFKPYYGSLLYLLPATICLILALASLKWPRVGGWIMVTAGAAIMLWFIQPEFVEGHITFNHQLGNLFVTIPLTLIGLLFLLDARIRRSNPPDELLKERHWALWDLRLTIILGAYLLIIFGASVYFLPEVLRRDDDGDRGARLIEGNSVILIWAPEGPGWNYKQEWGGYPSWRSIALYGREPVGFNDQRGEIATQEEMAVTNLCLYLSEDGLILMDEPQNIWRMPTVDEYLRSLTLDGENAGCAWDGEIGQQECTLNPDKETPLWDPTASPIYYWAYELSDESQAYFVNYDGYVNDSLQSGGNPRHSYRCVREP